VLKPQNSGDEPMTEPVTYIVLLNWNGWRDTIACLDSLCGLRGTRFRVIVCDNDSSDGSLEKIAAWCRGELPADVPDEPRLAALMGKAREPVQYASLTATEAASGRFDNGTEPVILIDNQANLGFAAGNNVGLRYALRQDDMTHAWILNNDTLVDPHCLVRMLGRLDEEVGDAVCGSVIHFFDNPETIQAIGGNRFNTRTGVAMESEGRFLPESDSIDVGEVEEALDYLSGCSLLVPRALLQTVGLLNEDYFLYYEEIDWFTRAGASVRRCIAADARLYHREGGSIGSPSWRQARPSLTADFHIFRSKHLFMRNFHPNNLLYCYLSSLAEVAKRVFRGQFRNAVVVMSVLLGARSL
jgi:GT2 family glycosyltransferase